MNVCQLTELKQTRAVRDGKSTSSAKMIPTPLWDIPAWKLQKAWLRIASRRSLASHLKNNSKAHILIVYTDVSIIKGQSAILLNLRCECDHHPQRQSAYNISVSSLTVEWKQLCILSIGLAWEMTVRPYNCHHPHRFNELASKPDMFVIHLLLGAQSWTNWADRIDWQAKQPSQVACGL